MNQKSSGGRVVAAFETTAQAEHSVQELQREGFDPSTISVNARDDLLVIGNAELREEATSLGGAPSEAAPQSQVKGGLLGSVAGALLGALIGAAIGLVFFDTPGTLISTAVCSLAAATATGVMGGYLRPERKREPRRSLQGYDVALGVRSDDPEEIQRAESILKSTGGMKVERIA